MGWTVMQVVVSRQTSQCTLSLVMCLGKFDCLKKQRNDLNLIKLENFCCHGAGWIAVVKSYFCCWPVSCL